MKINVRAFAFACALVWGCGLLLLTWWIMLFEGATGNPTFISMAYRGYNISFPGSLLGLVWGLADGLIGGAIFAWLYVRLQGSCPLCKSGTQ